jgi:U3 small nucleolar RNA-associated protein 6
MAAASDKARFYLEQYVPELQEYERKQIFSRDEISAITAKRSTFEHTLNARGSSPEDYLQYVAYETNLDRLRKLRCSRKGVKAATFNGQRTIFFIYDRATKKFPGSLELWMHYIDFCKKEKASKKIAKVFTSVLRLHPRKWSLWVVAAVYYAQTQGDMATARGYFQRGLRFCKDESRLYLEYARLELTYLAKLAARRKILGLDETSQEGRTEADGDENMIVLPTITAEDMDPEARKGIEEVNAAALQRLANAPAYMGAIPIAIFDAAVKQVSGDASDFADDFIEILALYSHVAASRTILEHVLSSLEASETAGSIMCRAKAELFAVDATSADYPLALGRSLALIRSGLANLPSSQQSDLAGRAVLMLLTYLRAPKAMDEDVLRVLEATIIKYLRTVTSSPTKLGSQAKVTPKSLIDKLRDTSRTIDATNLETIVRDAGFERG